MDPAVRRLGLTGGIGSGKSTVAGMLAQMGAAVIDADAISRALTTEDGAAIAPLKISFGATILTPQGALDRGQMRRLIYSDPGAKAKLEGIVHPLVGQAMAMQAQQAQVAGARCIVYDIPLLVESNHWRSALDRVLVIDCAEATQIARVMARDGMVLAEVQKIMTSQASRTQRLEAADWVVFNDGITVNVLAQHVREIGAQFGL